MSENEYAEYEYMSERNSASGSDFDQRSDQEIRAERRAHARTQRQLETCRNQLTEVHQDLLERTKEVESLKRKNDRLEKSNSDLLKDKRNSDQKMNELESALIDMTEKYENEVRLHDTTKEAWSRMNNRHSVNMQLQGQIL